MRHVPGIGTTTHPTPGNPCCRQLTCTHFVRSRTNPRNNLARNNLERQPYGVGIAVDSKLSMVSACSLSPRLPLALRVLTCSRGALLLRGTANVRCLHGSRCGRCRMVLCAEQSLRATPSHSYTMIFGKIPFTHGVCSAFAEVRVPSKLVIVAKLGAPRCGGRQKLESPDERSRSS